MSCERYKRATIRIKYIFKVLNRSYLRYNQALTGIESYNQSTVALYCEPNVYSSRDNELLY